MKGNIQMVSLKKSTKFEGVKGPLLTIVMDGVGIAADNGAESASDVSEQSAETADEQPEATDEEKNDDAKEE